MKFNYQARTKSGEIQSGTIEASSKEAALSLLHKYDLYVTFIEKARALFWEKKIAIFERITSKEVVMFSRQLSIMFRSQVSLIEALQTLAEQTKNQNFKEKILKISQEVEGGAPFSKALALYPHIFSSFYVSIVKSGESSGNLSESLDYLAKHLEREYRLLSGVRGAMIYPIFIIVVMFIVLIAMVIFVFPHFTEILTQSQIELPLVTKIVLAFFEFLRTRGWILFGGIVGLAVFLWRYSKSPQGRKILDKFFLGLPLIGSFFKKIYLTRFAENLSTLISGGLPIVKSLEITGDIVENSVYQKIILKTKEEVKKGRTISSVLSGYPDTFSPLVVQMVLVGEKTGTLEKTLEDIATFYQQEVERGIDNLLSILEPVLIVFLGLVVGFVVMAVFIPMYQMMGGI